MQGLVFTGFLGHLDETLCEADPAPAPGSNVVTFPGARSREALHNPFREPRTEAERRLGNEQQQRNYGKWLFDRFVALHPEHVQGYASGLDYLEGVSTLAPDQEAAISLDCERATRNILVLDYRAERPLPHVCRGLIEGCLNHFRTLAVCGQTEVIGSPVPRFKFHVVAHRYR